MSTALVDWTTASRYGMEQRVWDNTLGPCWGICCVCGAPANIIDWGWEAWVCTKKCHDVSWERYNQYLTEDEAYREHFDRGFGDPGWYGGTDSGAGVFL